jgi:hypothetical protein
MAWSTCSWHGGRVRKAWWLRRSLREWEEKTVRGL